MNILNTHKIIRWLVSTRSIKQSSSWEANSRSYKQEIPRHLCKPKIVAEFTRAQHCTHYEPDESIPPSHIFFFKIRVDTIHLRLGLPLSLFHSGSLTKIMQFSPACCNFFPLRSKWLVSRLLVPVRTETLDLYSQLCVYELSHWLVQSASSSWQLFSGSRKHLLLRNHKLHHLTAHHIGASIDPTQSQLNPMHILTIHSCKMHAF
jgi:hypothetical protein